MNRSKILFHNYWIYWDVESKPWHSFKDQIMDSSHYKEKLELLESKLSNPQFLEKAPDYIISKTKDEIEYINSLLKNLES